MEIESELIKKAPIFEEEKEIIKMSRSDQKRSLRNQRLSRVDEDEALPEKILKRSKSNFEEYSMDSNLVNQKILENKIKLNDQNLTLFESNDLKSIIEGSFDSNDEFSNFRFIEQKSKFEEFLENSVDVPKQLLQ